MHYTSLQQQLPVQHNIALQLGRLLSMDFCYGEWHNSEWRRSEMSLLQLVKGGFKSFVKYTVMYEHKEVL